VNGNNERPVICPRDPVWLRRMLEILPPGLRGKLAPYAGCVERSLPASVESRVVRPVVKR